MVVIIEMWGEPAVAEAGMMLQQPEGSLFSRRSCPGSWDPGSGGLHRLPGSGVWIVTCARTQASWWQQQQP